MFSGGLFGELQYTGWEGLCYSKNKVKRNRHVASSIGSEELAGLHPSASSHLLGQVLVYTFYSIFDLCFIDFSPYLFGVNE